MKYKEGDKVIESNYNRGIIKEIEYQQDDCYILGIDWGDGNLVWAAPTWVEPDYRALYEREKALREAAEKVLESYANGVVNNLPDENYEQVIAYYQQLKQQYNGQDII